MAVPKKRFVMPKKKQRRAKKYCECEGIVITDYTTDTICPPRIELRTYPDFACERRTYPEDLSQFRL
jgi:hypothetical protein